jgi:FkbM family methyltransferase
MLLHKVIKYFKNDFIRNYWEIDRERFLKRMDKRKLWRGRWYYDDRDADQFRSNEVLVRSVYSNRAIFLRCDRTSYVDAKVIRRGFHDLNLLELMLDFVKPDSVIADVGANVGAYTVPLAKLAPSCSVHAFEPNPAMLERLHQNLALNQLNNVVTHQIGVSDASGEETLYAVTEGNQGQSSFIPYSVREKKTRPITVKMETLDHLLLGGNQPVSVIKIDVQGYELNVLKGALTVLEESRPCIIFEYERELFPEPKDAERVKEEIRDLFHKLNYQVYYISPKYGSRMLAAVRWEHLYRCNLLAIPINPRNEKPV